MNQKTQFVRMFAASCVLLGMLAGSGNVSAQSAKKEFVSRDATSYDGNIHYTTGGQGPALILIHGFAETSRMWDPILPVLGEKFMVIAPDLPGIGDSTSFGGIIDMKTAAIRIHALAQRLGVKKARVVGHDIGLMVAYAYAAQFPSEVEKLVVIGCIPAWRVGLGSDLRQS
jgi:pimeloyl-ACP methyl ester carboxylesterase